VVIEVLLANQLMVNIYLLVFGQTTSSKVVLEHRYIEVCAKKLVGVESHLTAELDEPIVLVLLVFLLLLV